MQSENAQLVLESLSVGIPALTPVKSAFLKEACVWCLLQFDHPNGVLISCEICNDNVGYSIKWNDDFDLETLLRSYNMDDAIEFGAEALSLLLVREKTNYTAIKRAVRPSGIDYWLGYKKENDISLFSLADARLEISGILKETSTNTIKSRINKKLKQVGSSDQVFPVFISIIEFGTPKAEQVEKNAVN